MQSAELNAQCKNAPLRFAKHAKLRESNFGSLVFIFDKNNRKAKILAVIFIKFDFCLGKNLPFTSH